MTDNRLNETFGFWNIFSIVGNNGIFLYGVFGNQIVRNFERTKIQRFLKFRRGSWKTYLLGITAVVGHI